MSIKILAPQEAQKIAAGEVVERPANVVKELLENSIDAGATKITLYINEGGKKLIRIVDNGTGMTPEDAQLCILPHATSKITTVDELDTITTFGFRGEALASVASVSHMTLITKQHDAPEGIQLTITAGEIVNQIPAATNNGTDISIKDLFYNVPARKKFLKTDKTEWYAIQQLVQAYAFAYPALQVTLYHNQHMTMNAASTLTLRARAEQLFEENITQHIIELNAHDRATETTMRGIITNHQYGRYDRSHIYFIVNGRWVKNYKLSSALIKGYQNVLRNGQFPCAIISVTVPQHTIDINIHPRKEEVQFLHPRKIELMIQEAVEQLLNTQVVEQLQQPRYHSIQQSTTQQTVQNIPATPSAARESYIPVQQMAPPSWQKPSTYQVESPTLAPTAPPMQYEQTALIVDDIPTLSENYQLLGQLKQTYILLETEAGLMMVDQHAAHERVLYEQIGKQLAQAESIKLLFPEIITLSLENSRIEELAQLAQQFGIEIEPFGEQQVRVSATPVYIKTHMLKDIIISIAHEFHNTGQIDLLIAQKQMQHKLQAMIACKAAVKAHDILNETEMNQLIKQLLATPNRLTCPHGRPTSWVLSVHDLERKFKRIL